MEPNDPYGFAELNTRYVAELNAKYVAEINQLVADFAAQVKAINPPRRPLRTYFNLTWLKRLYPWGRRKGGDA